MIYKLDNIIQNYPWGSTTAMNALFGISNPDSLPQAELWMGAHPNGCSKIVNNGSSQLLSEWIEASPEQVLGRYTCDKFGELPYLMKVLSADKPLSIQVHPKKSKAVEGFERENQAGIPLSAPERNYKDPNHKPELVYALTNYKAMNGFRVISEIIELFEQSGCSVFRPHVQALKACQTPAQLAVFFRTVIALDGDEKLKAIAQLMDNIEQKGKGEVGKEAFAMVAEFSKDYPDDVGLFAPLMLNVIELEAGEAMFLHAETPHAYVKGTGIEIMANSDNVLRAGLTPKHIDVDELLDNTRFESIPHQHLRLRPKTKGHRQVYPIPVDDFKFEVLTLSDGSLQETGCQEFVRSAEIIMCLEGEMTLSAKDAEILLAKGESAIIADSAGSYRYSGYGKAVRAFN